MDTPQWRIEASALLQRFGIEDEPQLTVENFLDYADRVRDVVVALPQAEKEGYREFALHLRELRDDFEDRVAKDPMCIYKPKHAVALAAHKSQALIRYYFGAFRTSKTTFGVAELYWTLTDQHPYRPHPPSPASCAIVGVDYAHYAPNVFETKYIYGEQGNPLSPVFPDGGKWFYHYDERKKILQLACPECAANNRAGRCSHMKARLVLFSDEGESQAMEGAQYAAIQLDEQIDRSYFKVGRNRIKTVPNSFIVITETPKKGKGFWTQAELVPLAKSGETIPNTDTPICETFQIDQFQAGLVNHDKILASMATMSESEIRLEVFGEPMVALEKAIFDPEVVEYMRKTDMRDPIYGRLDLEVKDENNNLVLYSEYPKEEQRDVLAKADYDQTVRFLEGTLGDLAVWVPPRQFEQYVIGADVAHGLTTRDASAADVLRMIPSGNAVALEQDAQWHGWINAMVYAEELFKLGLYYATVYKDTRGDVRWSHFPWLVIERNGPGMEVIQCLIDMGCWFLFQDVTSGAQVKLQMQSQYGVGTTWASKPMLISILQAVVRARKFQKPSIVVRSKTTLDQLDTYIQEETDKGNVSFRGEGGTQDDCVMSLAVGTYGVKNFPLFDWELYAQAQAIKKRASMTKLDARSQDFWDAVHKEQDEKAQLLREREEGYGGDIEY